MMATIFSQKIICQNSILIIVFEIFKGPLNPDVTTPIEDVSPEKASDDRKNSKEVFDEVKKILNKVIYIYRYRSS